MNDLNASELNKAILINFGAPKPEYKRLVFHLRPSAPSADKEKHNESWQAERQDVIC